VLAPEEQTGSPGQFEYQFLTVEYELLLWAPR
jgi:hypothetical protein